MKFRKIFTRTAASLLCIGTLLSGLVSCSSDVKPIKSTDEELQVIGSIGKYDVYYDELRYIVLNKKEDMKNQYGDTIWDTAESAEQYREELESAVREKIVSSYYAVCAMADYYYVGGRDAMFAETAITDAVQEYVNEVVEECGSKSKYKKQLAENHMTDRLLRFYTTAQECAEELMLVLKTDLSIIPSDEESVRKILNSDKFIRTNHVFISGRTEESLALANQVRETLLQSDNPEMEIIILKGKYDSDFTMTTTHGKYFAKYTTDYGDAYEEAAFNLEVGGISEIVEGTDGSEYYIPGYFVILRLEPEKDYIEKNFDEFSDDIVGSEFNIKLEEFRTDLAFSYSDFGKSLDLLTIE